MNARKRQRSSSLNGIKLVYLNSRGKESGPESKPESRPTKRRDYDCSKRSVRRRKSRMASFLLRK